MYGLSMNEDKPNSEIIYDIKSYPSDQELIVTQCDKLAVEKQCTIMCDYIS